MYFSLTNDDNDDDMCMRNRWFFSRFANSGNLPTKGHTIDLLVNLAPNLRPKTHQKSNQEVPNIDNYPSETLTKHFNNSVCTGIDVYITA